jgi:hypothetical protein
VRRSPAGGWRSSVSAGWKALLVVIADLDVPPRGRVIDDVVGEEGVVPFEAQAGGDPRREVRVDEKPQAG